MRADLAILTPEALANFASVGLVNRAKNEIEKGQGPRVREEPDGTVIAEFDTDKVITKLLPGKTLDNTPCSCGAKKVCRHRIAAVLVYAAGAGVRVSPPWSITVDELTTWIGRRLPLVDAAEAAGVDIELDTNPAQARFSGCTVKFNAGAELEHADCDCNVTKCVHIPLAVRAFQRLSPSDRERNGIKVRLGPPARRVASPILLSTVKSFLTRLLEKGIADARGLNQARAEAQLLVRDYPWLDGIIDDLEVQRNAWETRSALHDAGRVRTLFMEAFARVRAAEKGNDPASLLGMGEPLEVPLDLARLLSLGARLSVVGSTRFLEVLFWDEATVVSWMTPISDHSDVAMVTAVGKTPLGALAVGQVMSKRLIRRARRTIEIRSGGETQVLPQKGQWVNIPPPYGFSGPTALLRHEQERPPWFLRPRARTEAIRVVATPNGVKNLSYSPGRQTLTGVIEDDEGGVLLVERSYEWFAPGAIASLVETLPQAHYVSGWLRAHGANKVLEPVAVVAGPDLDHLQVVVPDLAPDIPIPALTITTTDALDPLDTVFGRLESALETLAQEGILNSRIAPLTGILQAVGLRRIADAYTQLETARAAADVPAAIKAWVDVAIAVGLARA